VRARRAAKTKRPDRVVRVELTGELDAHAVEAFALEIRRLLKRDAPAVTGVRVDAAAVARPGRLA
jgi:hypothetical protein